MAGQDALNSAKAFGGALDLTGIVLTKADGDARGGAALSVRQVTGKPIVFVGVGEKLDALQPFDPERMAGRILGMPRMRPAIRSGSKGCRASSFSPTPTKTMGLPVTCRTDSAAPPRASPSALVSTMPVKSSAPPKALAEFSAS